MKKKTLKPSFLKKFVRIEYLALILSITAIWATYQQNITNKEFYHLSVKPLFKKTVLLSPNRIVYAINNYGLGVGIIDSIQMNYKGNPSSYQAMIDTILTTYESKEFSIIRGYDRDFVIKKEEDHQLFSMVYNGESDIEGWVSREVNELYLKNYAKLEEIINSIEVTIYFKDLYENSHIYSSME